MLSMLRTEVFQKKGGSLPLTCFLQHVIAWNWLYSLPSLFMDRSRTYALHISLYDLMFNIGTWEDLLSGFTSTM